MVYQIQWLRLCQIKNNQELNGLHFPLRYLRKGNRGSGAFTKLAWKIIRDEFSKQTGLNFDKQQLKNHLDVLRKRYNSVKAILDHTGFSWDVAQYMVLAEDDVWQEYIEVEFLDASDFNVCFIDSMRLLS